jgi:hypothetical protein
LVGLVTTYFQVDARFAWAQSNDIAQYATDSLQAYGFPPTSDPNGGWTPRKNFAAHEWHPATDVPSRLDWQIDADTGERVLRWPILAYYKGAWYPSIVWYYDNGDGFGAKYRSSNGNRWGTPERWAYVRMEKEVWNPITERMEVPGLPGSPPPDPTNPDDKPGVHMDDIQGQWMVDDLKRSFTTNKINEFLEASPYDEPDTGAPESPL